MITDKARELHKLLAGETAWIPQPKLSKEMWDELTTNCQPTEDEWAEMSEGCYFTAGDLMRVVKHMVKECIDQMGLQ
jgi:hypothetical protein